MISENTLNELREVVLTFKQRVEQYKQAAKDLEQCEVEASILKRAIVILERESKPF